jgi:hypothetical protein
VATEAVLERVAPGAGLPLRLLVAAAVGLLALASPVRAPGRLAGSLLSAAALAAGVHAVHLLRAALDPPGWAPWLLLLLVLLLDVASLRRIARLAGVEWLKVRRGRLFTWGLAGSVLVTLLAGATTDVGSTTSGWSVLVRSMGTGLFAAEVFALVLGAVALAGEASGGTLKMMLPHAYRRSEWVVAKTLVLLLVCLLFAVAVTGTSVAHAHWTAGLGDVTRALEPMFGEEQGGVETFREASAMASHAADAALSGLAALATTACLGVLLSCVFDGVVTALCLAFLLFAVLKFADVLLRLPRETLERIYAWYPGQIRELTDKLGRALNERYDEALLAAGLSLALLTGALALLLAVRALSRRDLKS